MLFLAGVCALAYYWWAKTKKGENLVGALYAGVLLIFLSFIIR